MSTSTTTSAPSVLVLGWTRVPSTIVENDGVIEASSLAIVAESDGMRYYLTECCGASAKGSSNSSTGVCCRGCYKGIPAYYGGLPPQSGSVTYALGDGVWHQAFVQDIDGYFTKAIAK